MRMNILLITFDTPAHVGGLEARSREYSYHLTKMGHKVSLVVLSDLPKSDFPTIHAERLVLLPSSSRSLLPALYSILKIAKSSRSSSLFLLTGATTPIGLFLSMVTFGWMRRMIFSFGKDLMVARNSFFQKLLYHFSVLMADRVGVNSRATARLLPASARSKVTLLYPGVNPELSPANQESNLSRGVILFVGRLVRRKGANDLIEAFRLLSMEMDNVELRIIGDGPERNNLVRLAQELRVSNKVIFLGEMTGEQLYKNYADCTVFCMPSRTLRDDIEGFGIVFLEAGVFGKPSIGTWSGGIPEAVLDKQTGLLVEEGNVTALKDALRTILSNKELARKMGENSRRRVLKEFTWRIASERLLIGLYGSEEGLVDAARLRKR